MLLILSEQPTAYHFDLQQTEHSVVFEIASETEWNAEIETKYACIRQSNV